MSRRERPKDRRDDRIEPENGQTYGLWDPPSRGPRIIFYLFLAMLVAILLPDIANNRTILLIALLIGGPAIAILAIRQWGFRKYYHGLARMTIETGVQFGVGITFLAAAQAFGLSFGT